MSHSHPSSLFARAARASPALALVVMLALPALIPCMPGDTQEIRVRHAQVLAAVNAAPYRFGDWVSVDIEVPPAARELLRPNAILSRRFQDLAGERLADLLVVHCSDARDMAGHYPPICYPTHGWDLTKDGVRRECIMFMTDRPVTMRVYEFHRTDRLGVKHTLRVFNCFLLPDGTTAVDMGAVRRLADRPSISTQGVAQIQVVIPGGIDPVQAKGVVSEVLDGAASLLAVLGQGAEDDYAFPAR